MDYVGMTDILLLFIGTLFRKIDTDKVESELGVFITPHIYTDGKLSAEDSELLYDTNTDKSLFEKSGLLRLLEDD